MMLSDVCLSDVCRVHPVSGRRVLPAGWIARIGWSGPARPAWLKAAPPCALPLQSWAGTYRGCCPPTACYVCQNAYLFSVHHLRTCLHEHNVLDRSRWPLAYAWSTLSIDSCFRPTAHIMMSCNLLSNYTSKDPSGRPGELGSHGLLCPAP